MTGRSTSSLFATDLSMKVEILPESIIVLTSLPLILHVVYATSFERGPSSHGRYGDDLVPSFPTAAET